MKSYADRAILKNNAKTMMEGKYYASVMALIFYNMITLLMNNFSSSLSLQISSTLRRLLGLAESGGGLLAVSCFVVFLVTALCNVFQIGVCLFFLNIACDQYYSTFDLFYGFFQNFKKSYGLSLVLTLLATLWLAPADILIYLLRQSGGHIRLDVLILLILLQAVLTALYFPISLALSQSCYIMLDFPDLPLAGVLKQSVKIMDGRKLELFRIKVSFLPLMLLMLLTLGLGNLWLTPYRNMTYALFYLDNMREDA